MNSKPIDFEEALATLGSVLEARGLAFEIVAVGGGALSLLGLIARSTKDIDVVAIVSDGDFKTADPLPLELSRARDEVAATLSLPNDWLNPGPASLLDFGLPPEFAMRLVTRRFAGLTLHLAGRFDQICFKFYAAVDHGPRSKHVDDLRRLKPTRDELLAAAAWARAHDRSPEFADMSRQTLSFFGVEEDDAAY
jgi:hypothetical protein